MKVALGKARTYWWSDYDNADSVSQSCTSSRDLSAYLEKARLSRNTAEEKDGRYESMCVKAEFPAAQQRGNPIFQDPKSNWTVCGRSQATR